MLARIVRRPLESLVAAATALGGGDLTVRSEVTGPPETRAVATAFNLHGLATRRARPGPAVVRRGRGTRAAHPAAGAAAAAREPRGRSRAGGRRDLEAAHAEALRLSRLVTGLLELARAEDAAQPDVAIELAPAVAGGSNAGASPRAPPACRSSLRAAPDLRVRAAGDRVEQVLDNLLANAVAAAPRGSAIDVTAARAGAQVELRVSDEGPGLSQEEKARAFDRFWRGRETGDGSGLGLAIVRRLAERDGGSVELADAPGGGLEAIVRLRA